MIHLPDLFLGTVCIRLHVINADVIYNYLAEFPKNSSSYLADLGSQFWLPPSVLDLKENDPSFWYPIYTSLCMQQIERYTLT